jgi:CRP-like cAMP-binding protein
VFGERALLEEDMNRTARVRAKTAVTCLAIGRTEIERLIAEDERVADRLRQASA